jgi:hypothetical protein
MLRNFLNLDSVMILTKATQKSLKGGGSVDCFCNGTPTGTASSSSGCAALCSACVRNGGCKEQ